MSRQVPFIARPEITDLIDEAIQTRGSRKVLCIQASGGIGKTRLLQEVYQAQQPVIADELPGGFVRKDLKFTVIKEFMASEWDKQFLSGVYAMASDLGVAIQIKDAQFDFLKMRVDLESAIRENADAIIVGLGNEPGLVATIQSAIEQSRVVLTHDNYLDGLPSGCIRVFQDHQRACSELSRQMFEDLNYQGKIAIVFDPQAIIQQQRYDVLKTELATARNIQVVDKFGHIGDDMVESVRQQAIVTLKKNPDLKAFWVGFDEMAKGVVQALVDLKRRDVYIYSFDLNPSSMELMLMPNSPWKATVAANPHDIGALLVRLAVLASYGIPVDPQYRLSMKLITQEDLRQQTLRLGNIWIDTDLPRLAWHPLIEGLQKSKIEQQRGWQVLPIIDFDDHRFRIQINVGRFIADSLEHGENLFQPYLQTLYKLHRQEESQADPNLLSALRDRANQDFVECFNRITKNRRIVLLFDTTEKLRDTEVYKHLLYLSVHLENAVLIFAGRTSQEIYKALEPRLASDVIYKELQPLGDDAANQYLQAKLGMVHVNDFSDETQRKILCLARGRPILIDMAVEWIARGLSLAWKDVDLDKLQDQLATSERERDEHERQLVSHIALTRQPLDWLWLLMACIYPLDEKMIAAILNKSEAEAQRFCQDAAEYVFVKRLPDGRLSLHDEIQRMITKHVWPIVDPKGVRRKSYYQQAALYLQSKADHILVDINQLKQKEKHDGVIGKLALDVFSEMETSQREYWVLREQQILYTFSHSPSDGLRTFVELFDHAEKETNYAMELLLQEAEGFIKQLAFEQRYEIVFRRARYLTHVLDYGEARQRLEYLRRRYTGDLDRKVDILAQLAHVERLSGNPRRTVRLLHIAMKTCQQDEKINLKHVGNILNSLGLAYRQLGEWENAESYYKEAINVILKTGNKRNLANAYNNLGYVTGLKSDYASALLWSRQALDIQEKLGDVAEFDQGRTHNVLGVIYRHKEDYQESLVHINLAIGIFTRLEKTDWLAKAYLEQGTTKWHKEQLSEAEVDLQKSLTLARENNLIVDLPTILHRLGHVVWEQRKFTEAEHYFLESAALGQKISDVQQTVNSFEGLVELYYYIGSHGEPDKREHWFDKAIDMASNWEQQFDKEKALFPLYTGSRLRILGNIAFDRGHYNDALEYYLKAYPYIAQRGGYSRYMLPKALDWLEERIDLLPGEIALSWCNQIEEKWRRESLDKMFPEMLTTCEIARVNARERIEPASDQGN